MAKCNQLTLLPYKGLTVKSSKLAYLADCTYKCILILQFHFIINARQVENTPALGALQDGAGPVTVITVPVVVAHSLHNKHNSTLAKYTHTRL